MALLALAGTKCGTYAQRQEWRKPARVRTRVLARSRNYQPRNRSCRPNSVSKRRETPANVTLTTIVANAVPKMFTRITHKLCRSVLRASEQSWWRICVIEYNNLDSDWKKKEKKNKRWKPAPHDARKQQRQPSSQPGWSAKESFALIQADVLYHLKPFFGQLLTSTAKRI